MRTALLITVALLIAAGVWVYATAGHTADQSVTQSFTLDVDFDAVTRVLRQADASQAVIDAAGNSEFVDLKWDDLDIDLKVVGGLGVAIERTGTLRVRTLNETIGRHVIVLDQHVAADKSRIESRQTLREGTDKLVGYEMTTRFEPIDAGTQVELTLRQAVKTRAPFFLAGLADRRVRESAEAALANQERAIREVITTRAAELAEAEASGDSPGPLKQLLRGLLNRTREGEAPAEP